MESFWVLQSVGAVCRAKALLTAGSLLITERATPLRDELGYKGRAKARCVLERPGSLQASY